MALPPRPPSATTMARSTIPNVVVEHGDTSAMFQSPQDPRTSDDVQGRFG
jgi:phosphate transport system ATP-binding protein